ncbi:MAG: hypothetical protein ACRC8C_01695 [Mycoplasmoidaceae bacterium]
MNKKIKLTLLGTLITSSALAITLPIVSCSASTSPSGPLIPFDPTPPITTKTFLKTDSAMLNQATIEVTKVFTPPF